LSSNAGKNAAKSIVDKVLNGKGGGSLGDQLKKGFKLFK
jgi:hypothetical protein